MRKVRGSVVLPYQYCPHPGRDCLSKSIIHPAGPLSACNFPVLQLPTERSGADRIEIVHLPAPAIEAGP
jgi:hypothetical protein